MTTLERPYPQPVAEDDEPTPAGHSIIRRRGLPTGRAVLGGLLVTLAAVGLFVAYRQTVGEPDTNYVVVDQSVAAGARITAGDLRTEAIDLPDDIATTAFTSVDAVVGAVAVTPLGAGELLSQNNAMPLATGEDADDPPWREVSFTVPVDKAVDGQIRAGEVVDLAATYVTQGEAETVVVFRSAQVLRVSEASSDVLTGGSGLTLTVALIDPADVLATINAVDDASAVTVIRATKAPDQTLPDSFDYVPGVETMESTADGE